MRVNRLGFLPIFFTKFANNIFSLVATCSPVKYFKSIHNMATQCEFPKF